MATALLGSGFFISIAQIYPQEELHFKAPVVPRQIVFAGDTVRFNRISDRKKARLSNRWIGQKAKALSLPIQIQEIREIINDVVRTGALKFLTGGVAVGDTAGLGAGATAHQDIERHVTDNKGS